MKKLISLFFLMPFLSFSQISVTFANLPDIGDTVLISEDNGNFSAGLAGANQSWDFSNASGQIEMLLGFIDPSTTPYQSFFPNSNISVEDDSTFFYLDRSINGLAMLGVVDSGMVFPWQKVMLPAPLNYLDTLSYLNVMSQLDTVLSPPIPSIFLNVQGPYVVDSVSITFGELDEFIVDAWGQVQMPTASYDALRIFQSTFESESYNIRLTDTTNGQSHWVDTLQSLYWQESRYLWRTDDALVTWNLVEMETDSLGTPDGDISFYSGNSFVVSPAIVDVYKLVDVSCNGLSDGFIMLDIFGTAPPFTFSWTGPAGFTSNSQDIFNLDAGIYEVTVTDASGNSISETYIIAEPSLLSASITQSLIDLIVSVNGGTPPYSYIWNSSISDTFSTITPLANGLYSCDVIDKSGCITSVTFTVTNIATSIIDINSKKRLIKIVDVLGRRGKMENGTLLYLYDDGTVEKKIITE